MTPGQRPTRVSARYPGGRTGHAMPGRAIGPARAVASRTGSGHGRCPARSPVVPIPGLARPVARIPARAVARMRARPVALTPARAVALTPARVVRMPARAVARTPARAVARIPARAVARIPARVVRMRARAVARIPARAAARIPARAEGRAPARTRLLAAHPWRHRSMTRSRGGKAIPGGPPARPPVTARTQTGLLEPATTRAAATSGTPASVRPAVTARLIMTSWLVMPIPGRRRTAAAVAAAMPGRDGRRPNLAKTRRASALTRPAAPGAA
jgi:hypothetical protein